MSFNDYSNRIWGGVWGAGVALVGVMIAGFAELLDKFLSVLFDILIWVFLFPLKITELVAGLIGLDNKFVIVGVAAVVGFFSWTIAFKVFRFIFSVFRRSPL